MIEDLASKMTDRVVELEAQVLALQTQLERANGEGYILAMAVLQSDLDLDDTEEAARDYFLPKSLKG